MTDEERKATEAKAAEVERPEETEQTEQPQVELSYAELVRLRARLTRKYH